MSFFAQYPASASGNNASVGSNGAPAPSSSTEIGFIDGSGNLQGVSPSEPLPITAASFPLPTGAATAANQVTEINLITARLSGSLVPAAFDEIDLTYVPSGNGVGQIATAIYKLASSTVATLTLTYDASNRLSTVVKS